MEHNGSVSRIKLIDFMSDSIIKIFDSVVNTVTLVSDKSNDLLVVRKSYGHIAKKTGIAFDLRRQTIECTVILFLEGVIQRYKLLVSIPKIIRQAKGWIELQYIPNRNLLETDVLDWPSTKEWTGLIDLLIYLNDLPENYLPFLFGSMMQLQNDCRRIIYKYKSLNSNEHLPRKVFCLGDLNLSNLIFQNSLYIIDFECAHIGSRGYDLGQLVGQLQALFKIKPLESISKLIEYIEARLNNHEELHSQFLIWKNTFYKYYTRKFGQV